MDNIDFKFKLHIVRDVVEYLDLTKIPDNIEVVIVEVINSDCIDLEKESY